MVFSRHVALHPPAAQIQHEENRKHKHDRQRDIHEHHLAEKEHQHGEHDREDHHPNDEALGHVASALGVTRGGEQEHEVDQDRADHERHLLDQVDILVTHEFERRGDIIQREDQEDVDEHIGKTVGPAFAVEHMIIDDAVAEEQPHDDQKAHQREVDIAHAHIAVKVGRDRDDHLAEGEHDVQHRTLGEMLKVHTGDALVPAGKHHRSDTEQDRPKRGIGRAVQLEFKHSERDESRLTEQDDRHAGDAPCLNGVALMVASLDEVLSADVQEDQRPRDMVHGVTVLPVGACADRQKVHQEHVDKQEHMIANAVSAVSVDIIGGVVPDLDHRQRTDRIHHERRKGDEAVLGMVQKGVIPPDDKDEDQIVDQLDVLDLLLLLFQKLLDHLLTCPQCSAMPNTPDTASFSSILSPVSSG